MSDRDRLTWYPDQIEVLDGSPIYDDLGRLVAVMNDQHPRAAENAALFAAARENAMTPDTARQLARKLGYEGMAINLAATIILNFKPEPTVEEQSLRLVR